MEGLVLLLHLLVAVVEAYLALVISKEGAELLLRSINFRNNVTALVTLTVRHSLGQMLQPFTMLLVTAVSSVKTCL